MTVRKHQEMADGSYRDEVEIEVQDLAEGEEPPKVVWAIYDGMKFTGKLFKSLSKAQEEADKMDLKDPRIFRGELFDDNEA